MNDDSDLPDVSEPAPEKVSASIAELEKRLIDQTHGRACERFVFIVILAVVYDTHAFKGFESWAPPICLTLLEIGGLYVLAEMTGVRDMAALIRTGVLVMAKRVRGKDDPGAG